MKGSEFITATEFVRKSVACPGKFGRFGLAFSKKGTAQEKNILFYCLLESTFKSPIFTREKCSSSLSS